ncbi:membrane-bound PQQ-dependent dehydrogenase, glucose/quinate/shikimate family [Sphingobium xenophagum]
MPSSTSAKAGRIAVIALGLIILIVGLLMLGGGAYLVALGGSWYFALAGLGLCGSGCLLMLRRPAGAGLYGVVFIATIVWALWDVGLTFWPLISRLFAPAVLAIPVLLLLPALRPMARPVPRKASLGLACLIALALAGTIVSTFQPRPLAVADAVSAPIPGRSAAPSAGGDWPYWGRNPSGTRFATLDKITPANVAGLKVAWTYRTGEIPKDPAAFVTTPLHIDGRLYGCTQSNVIFALDADTGKELWRYDPHAQGNFRPRCRGVGYHDDAPAPSKPAPSTPVTPRAVAMAAPSGPCVRRIISTTVDARLVAVDAVTGLPCADFGNRGVVSLRTSMSNMQPGFYFPTAAPTIMRNLIIVGGLVRDNYEEGEPSGVVRAFDVHTGKLVWAWDMGNPDASGHPPAGKSFTPGTPNVWSTPSFDDKLGLVYLPTGNATPDSWGPKRSPAAERYSSSIVALDVTTGRVRWSFQTVHHDLWDYDVPAQPALYDVPDGHGGTIPALIQVTKRGQIFMLDRRTGKPIAKVEERPVPQKGGARDDFLSPTQPYSTGMPAIGAERLTEARMWGATPLDQLYCRIAFRKARYDGDFSPPGLKTAIYFPGWFGGMNWGSVSIAENRGTMIVNDTRVPVVARLVPRAEYDAKAQKSSGEGSGAPQYGTPYGLEQGTLESPLAVPCQEPPYGAITAIDLATRKVLWSMPLGTLQDSGPLGLAMHMGIPIGLPAIGGPVTTASGLVFMAGTQDHYIRAFDIRNGHELWKGRLPMGAETTPMTYVSPRSGQQYLAIAVGGNLAQKQDRGDYIVAFSLQH